MALRKVTPSASRGATQLSILKRPSRGRSRDWKHQYGGHVGEHDSEYYERDARNLRKVQGIRCESPFHQVREQVGRLFRWPSRDGPTFQDRRSQTGFADETRNLVASNVPAASAHRVLDHGHPIERVVRPLSVGEILQEQLITKVHG